LLFYIWRRRELVMSNRLIEIFEDESLVEKIKRVFERIGRYNYIKLPKEGTNPRGVEFTREALSRLIKDSESRVIEIHWEKTKIEFNAYKRWIDLWRED